MKKFLLLVIVFLGIAAAIVLLILSRADGFTDAFYLRFTTPQQKALILGTSRSAQGILPSVVNSGCGRSDIFNYSFTNENSPYGEVYYTSIFRKLDPSTRDGLFILSVDPWSLSAQKEEPENAELFREKGLTLDKMTMVNSSPNYQYLLRCYEGLYLRLLIPDKDRNMELHKDGWLEITVPMDSALVRKRTDNKMQEYRKNILPHSAWSDTRLEWLGRIADELSKHGKVVLVRLPVCPEMLAMENAFVPDFEQQLEIFAAAHAVDYFSLISLADSCQFTDGNHLYKTSAEFISRKIAEVVKETN